MRQHTPGPRVRQLDGKALRPDNPIECRNGSTEHQAPRPQDPALTLFPARHQIQRIEQRRRKTFLIGRSFSRKRAQHHLVPSIRHIRKPPESPTADLGTDLEGSKNLLVLVLSV